MLPQPIKPGRGYYLLSAIVLVAGAAVFVFLLITRIGGLTDKLVQMEAPGSAEMNFSEPGRYTIFYERESVFNGQVYSASGSFSGIWCTVVSKETNTPVRLTQPSINTRYTVGGRSGASILEFEIDRPGIYEVSAEYRDNPNGSKIILAVGTGVTSAIATTVIVGLAVMFGTLILAGTIAIVTFVKRRRAKKAYMQPTYPSYQTPFPGS